jgi:hypothetical protein
MLGAAKHLKSCPTAVSQPRRGGKFAGDVPEVPYQPHQLRQAKARVVRVARAPITSAEAIGSRPHTTASSGE